MPKFKNVSQFGDLDLPVLDRIVLAGEVFDVPAELADSFTAQPDVWEPVKEKKGDS